MSTSNRILFLFLLWRFLCLFFLLIVYLLLKSCLFVVTDKQYSLRYLILPVDIHHLPKQFKDFFSGRLKRDSGRGVHDINAASLVPQFLLVLLTVGSNGLTAVSRQEKKNEGLIEGYNCHIWFGGSGTIFFFLSFFLSLSFYNSF